MLLYEVCNALERGKIPYAVVGGYAVALHGAVRGTVDVDIAIQWTLKNLKKAEKILKDLGLVSRLPIDADSVYHFRNEYINNRNLLAWNFYDPCNQARQIDVMINYDLKGRHIKRFKTASGTVRVLARKDLIEMKKSSGRPQDLEDVKALEQS